MASVERRMLPFNRFNRIFRYADDQAFIKGYLGAGLETMDYKPKSVGKMESLNLTQSI